jgi:Tol biopolymer transport system component
MRWIVGSLLSVLLALSFLVLARQSDVQLVLVDRDGRRTPVGRVPGSTFAPRVSPDGREVVYDANGELWVAKLSDFQSKRRVSSSEGARGPLWTPDGKRIIYVTFDEGEEALHWRAADGSGAAERLVKPARAPESWPLKAPGLSYITLKSGGDYDVWTYSSTTKRVAPFVAMPGTAQHSSHFSPDGRWIAYASAETVRLEIYVRPFPAGTPAVRVTSAGGEHPLWSPDQKELFFDVGGRLFAVPIKVEPTFSAGKPVALPIMGYIQGPLRRQYDLMPDGKQFLMMFPVGR